MSRVGVEPKWLMSTRIGALRTAPGGLRAVSNHRHEHGSQQQHKQQWGYVAILGVAAGMVALICFYLCVWLVRQQSRQRGLVQVPHPPPPPPLAEEDHQSSPSSTEMMLKRAPSGDGDNATHSWNSESVELVVMAGEHVPTFVAHPASP